MENGIAIQRSPAFESALAICVNRIWYAAKSFAISTEKPGFYFSIIHTLRASRIRFPNQSLGTRWNGKVTCHRSTDGNLNFLIERIDHLTQQPVASSIESHSQPG